MVSAKSLGTGNIPLLLAESITKSANKEWEDGSFFEKISPITQDLLRYWNPDGSFADTRKFNFHPGQWQAILNSIYIHEVLKIKGVHDMYMSINPELLQEMDLVDLKRGKYLHPKYCIKMATGTGKTWVMHALLIWHYLNAKHEDQKSGRYSKNFLLIAPGIIVYERLLDAFLGKRQKDDTRDFEKSDFFQFQDLFIPESYRPEVLGFVQNSVAQKSEIGQKITGDGLIAITNWHLLVGEHEDDESGTALDSPDQTIKKLLPVTPGTGKGHSLSELDRNYLKGTELNYLAKLDNLVSFNDEAHHLGEWKTQFETMEKKWQIALSIISETKKEKFIQVDFSATPYIVTGSKLKRTKHFFPHTIVDFELSQAIRLGLVKTVAIDKRKEIASIPLDFKADRDEGNDVVSLSGGQREMLRAGIKKLKILEEEFTRLDSSKFPKMLIMCEDTTVVPFVTAFFKQEGISEDDILEVHSNRKGEIGEKEWHSLRQVLFDVDKHVKPKIIISVLMLKEGFDVSNVCVIVPLRASSSSILLEQTIGRGLRLMWREPEYDDLKQESREKLLVRKEEPENYIDILSIIEQPNFIEFYDKELGDALVEIHESPKIGKVTGDIIQVGLKDNFKDYDMFIPLILRDKDEELMSAELSYDDLEPFPVPYEQLKLLVNQKGSIFKSEEMTVKTKFGEYLVTADIFTATNYNSFIQKIVNSVTSIPVKISKKQKNFPQMQINTRLIAQLIDEYIRQKLFSKNFEPLKDNNWRILLLTESKIVEHIVKNVAKKIYELQNNVDVNQAKIEKRYFSELEELKIRETFSINVAKTIYSTIGYPSNKGGFEKNFINFIDSDSKVKSFMKINEQYHDFASIIYIRDDGLLAHYYPDFIVKVQDKIFIVETKAEKDLENKNVQSKQLATIDWINKINELQPDDRMNCVWSYVLLGEKTFYGFSEKGGDILDILQYAELNKSKIKGTMNQFLGIDEKY